MQATATSAPTRHPAVPAKALQRGRRPACGAANDLEPFANDRSFVMSFARGVSVIQAFANVSRPLTIAEVSRRVHFPRSAVRRLLHTLAELGYVMMDGTHYALTPKTLELGNAFASSSNVTTDVQPIVSRLAERLRTFCALSVPENDESMLMCLAGRASSAMPRHLTPGPGSKAPLYASASGLLFLGQSSEAELDAYFDRVAMLPITFRTQTLPAQLRESLNRVRAQGYAVVDRTFADDLKSIAVPVTDAGGAVVAAMLAVVSAERLTDVELRSTLVPALGAAAREAGARWRWRR